MGHHSKKGSKTQPVPAPIDINSMGQLLNNVDVNSMANMMSSIDINQIISMLSNAFVPAAPPVLENVTANEEINNTTSTESPKEINISDIFQKFTSEGTQKQPVLNPVLPPNDPVVIVLSSLKPFLASDKSTVIDDMIKLLGIKAVIDSIFPSVQPELSTLAKISSTNSTSLAADGDLN